MSTENNIPVSPSKALVLRAVTYRPRSRRQLVLDQFLRSTSAWCSRYLLPPLRRRRADLEDALEGGWELAATWIKVVAYLVGTVGVLGAAALLADLAVAAMRHLVGHHPGLFDTVTVPVRAYLDRHGAGLSLSPANLFNVWLLAGAVLLIAAAAGSLVGRLAWLGFGSATAAMVWSATAAGSRPVAVGVTVLVWTLLSLGAFKGARWPLLLNVTSSVTHITPTYPVPAAPGPQDSDPDDVW